MFTSLLYPLHEVIKYFKGGGTWEMRKYDFNMRRPKQIPYRSLSERQRTNRPGEHTHGVALWNRTHTRWKGRHNQPILRGNRLSVTREPAIGYEGTSPRTPGNRPSVTGEPALGDEGTGSRSRGNRPSVTGEPALGQRGNRPSFT
ncbi:hypothetical protein EYF80_008031 [Liparis tanakae]|uniref:Uncharacterized protein n=1 Tax=Liparis tanakae TaxID=230148 RepID=A0A4Z2IUJ0_9TELE|nr:hypothetical protein EYF80_008031 [Liparis tanakae]